MRGFCVTLSVHDVAALAAQLIREGPPVTDPASRSSDIFLSYSSSDRILAEKLANDLRGLRVTVWWDGNLDLGDDWRAEIKRQLEAAAVVLVLVTPSSLAAKGVVAEWSDAFSRSQRVITVLTGGSQFA